MRANEFLNEVDGMSEASFALPNTDKEVKITIPVTINVPDSGNGSVLPQSKGRDAVGNKRINTTIANPANVKDMPSSPIFISPLQQQLEMMKQQGGKVSPVINQIIADTGPDSDPNDGPFEQFDDEEDEHPASIYYGIDDINGAK
jgi:hypothetical protein